MAHKFARQMMEYAQDAQETDEPWERWQFFNGACNEWVNCTCSIDWDRPLITDYRRKPNIDNELKFDSLVSEIKNNFNIANFDYSIEYDRFQKNDIKAIDLFTIRLYIISK